MSKSTIDSGVWRAVVEAGIEQADKNKGNYGSAFGRMFEDGIQDAGSGIGIDNLVSLFGSPSSAEASPMKSFVDTPPATRRVEMSVLSQRGKSLAEDIHSEVASDAARLEDLEAACPHWQENVAYAMHQRNEDDLHEALHNVQQAKDRLVAMKNCFMNAWQQQHRVLSLYELAMKKSLCRFQDPPLARTEFSQPQIVTLAACQESQRE